MKNRIFFCVIMILFMSSIIFNVNRLETEIKSDRYHVLAHKELYLTVGAKEAEFKTIQDALKKVSPERHIIWITDPVRTESRIVIDKDVSIRGFAPDKTTIQGALSSQRSGGSIFIIKKGCSVVLENLTIQNGNSHDLNLPSGGLNIFGHATIKSCNIINNRSFQGGGIMVGKGSVCNIENSYIGSNTSSNCGGGIEVDKNGTLILKNSTLSKNTTKNRGGGIHIKGKASIEHCTIAENASLQNKKGSGVYVQGDMTLISSLISNNAQGDLSFFSTSTLKTENYNFIGDGSDGAYLSGDPKMGSLIKSENATFLYDLSPDSPVVNSIPYDYAYRLTTDQRGKIRHDGAPDIGAYEF